MNTNTVRIIIVTAIVPVLGISDVLLFTAKSISDNIGVKNEYSTDINPEAIAGRW